jgi:hypothetical protein
LNTIAGFKKPFIDQYSLSVMSNLSKQTPMSHGFLMIGTEKLFSCHLPMYFMPEHSFQVILEIELGGNDIETYLKTRKENPGEPLIIMNDKRMLLEELVNSGSYKAAGYFANENGDPKGKPPFIPFIGPTTVTIKRKLLFESLNPNAEYPENLTYYLYGANSEFHLSHLLSKAPNFQQELDVTLSGDISDKIKELDSEIVKISISSLNERSKQPITIDPLTQSEYTIRMDDVDDEAVDVSGKIEIINKFWINNSPLNLKEDHNNHHHNMNM